VKILYVSQYFPPEMGAPAARVAELSRYWVRRGNQVTVLTGFPNHPTGEVPPPYRSRMRRLIYRENVNEVNVVRSWLLPFPNRKAYERVLNYTSFCASAAMTGSFLSSPDLVIATSPQLLAGLAGWWIARMKGVPFIFEVRDLWPESLAGVGMGSEHSVLYRALHKIAAFLYQRADHIVVVSPAFKSHLVEQWNLTPEKISVVENGVETNLFSPQVPAAELRREIGENKFVVSYIGTLGMAHGLDTVIEAAAQLQTARPDVLFLMVGEGADKARLMQLAERRHLNNIRFLDQQPREKVPSYVCASDACMVLLKDAPVFQTVIPTKMLEFMACGKPVILGVKRQARQILQAAQAGLTIAPENAYELASAIIGLADNRSLCEKLGANGRNYIVKHFARERTARIYESILECIVEKQNLPVVAAVQV
jgi:glycosyltransferase involved in cell wall biosynthesis